MQIYLPIAEVSVNFYLLIALGGGVGVVSGLFGVGGGFLITPLLILIGIPPAVAVATGANQVAGASFSGVLVHWRRRTVDFKMGLVLMAGGLAGSAVGVQVFAVLRELGQVDLVVSLCYVVMLGTIGALMLVEGLQARDPEFRKLAEENLASSLAFHEQFGRRAGVVTLPDGIQYQVLKSGEGTSPGPDDYVVVNYKVVQLDGTVLSEGTGEQVRVGGVVDGAARILQMMTPGSRWLVAIPPEHAHGPGGKYPEIGPNITLFGEIELVENRGPQRPD